MNKKIGLSEKYTQNWDKRSSIRTRPIKKIDFSKKGFYFPEENQVLLLSSEMSELTEESKNELLIKSLYKYLNDIVTLEIDLINSACSKIIKNDLMVSYSEQAIMNAYTVLIDEFYHVYIAKDLMIQLRSEFPFVEKIPQPISDSYKSFLDIQKRLDEEHKDLFEIIAVCIFEVTLVKELVEFFNTDSVHPCIKDYVNDHMNDEARHYIYFLDLLTYTWEKLPLKAQQDIGINIADFILMYLNIKSDKSFNNKYLDSVNNNKEKNIKLINKLYKGFEVTPELPIAKNVLQGLRKSGMLDNEFVKQGFKDIGWIV